VILELDFPDRDDEIILSMGDLVFPELVTDMIGMGIKRSISGIATTIKIPIKMNGLIAKIPLARAANGSQDFDPPPPPPPKLGS